MNTQLSQQFYHLEMQRIRGDKNKKKRISRGQLFLRSAICFNFVGACNRTNFCYKVVFVVAFYVI